MHQTHFCKKGVNLCKKNNLEYIEIDVPSYPIAISCKGNYYFRSGSTSQKLAGIELESFILRKRGATWDNVLYPLVKIEDLDQNAIQKFKEFAIRKKRIDDTILEEDTETLLDKLHLINNGYLTNAALLLFSKDPERYFTGAFIKVGFFETDADLIYQDEVRGSLFEQIDKVIELIFFKYMKQYESGVPIQISVYKDKLYITNVGKLPDHWTEETLYQKHGSKPYNPNIAHVFYLAGHIESWGRGIEKIFDSYIENDLPMPKYYINPTDIMIEFDAPQRLVIDNFSKVTNRVNDRVNDTMNKILESLYDDPGYTITELANIMKMSRKSISNNIKKLKDLGIIERVRNNKKGYWKIKR